MDSKKALQDALDAAVEWVNAKNQYEKDPWPGATAEIPRGIDTAMDHIDLERRKMERLLAEGLDADPRYRQDLRDASHNLHENAASLGDLVTVGTDITLGTTEHGKVFSAWQDFAGSVGNYAESQSQEIGKLQKAHPGVADYDLGYAAGSLDTAAAVAREQRIRGIRMSLNGNLAEYALEDAKNLGLVAEPGPREQGILRGQVPEGAILERTDGKIVPCPVPPDLPMPEVGKQVTLHEGPDGFYGRRPHKEIEHRDESLPKRVVLEAGDFVALQRPGYQETTRGIVTGKVDDTLFVRQVVREDGKWRAAIQNTAIRADSHYLSASIQQHVPGVLRPEELAAEKDGLESARVIASALDRFELQRHRSLDDAKVGKVDHPEVQVVGRVDQDRLLSGDRDRHPDAIQSMQGKVLAVSKDREQAIYLQAAGKVTKLVPADPAARVPDIPQGKYGNVRISGKSVTFSAREQERGQQKQRQDIGG